MLAPLSAPRDDRIELRQLRQRHRALKLRHSIIRRKKLRIAHGHARRAVIAFVGREANCLRERIIVCDRHAAVAAGDVLEFVEAETADVSERADGFPGVTRAVSLGAVFDHGNVFLARQLDDRFHVARVASQMHGDDRARRGRNFRADCLRRHHIRPRIEIGEDGNRPLPQDRNDRPHVSDRRDDDFIARRDADGHQRRVNARRRAARGDGVFRAAALGEVILEFKNLFAVRVEQRALSQCFAKLLKLFFAVAVRFTVWRPLRGRCASRSLYAGRERSRRVSWDLPSAHTASIVVSVLAGSVSVVASNSKPHARKLSRRALFPTRSHSTVAPCSVVAGCI